MACLQILRTLFMNSKRVLGKDENMEMSQYKEGCTTCWLFQNTYFFINFLKAI